ncbi:MAG: hypothetical protein AB7E24_09150 [Novosphingobium sp.]
MKRLPERLTIGTICVGSALIGTMFALDGDGLFPIRPRDSEDNAAPATGRGEIRSIIPLPTVGVVRDPPYLPSGQDSHGLAPVLPAVPVETRRPESAPRVRKALKETASDIALASHGAVPSPPARENPAPERPGAAETGIDSSVPPFDAPDRAAASGSRLASPESTAGLSPHGEAASTRTTSLAGEAPEPIAQPLVGADLAATVSAAPDDELPELAESGSLGPTLPVPVVSAAEPAAPERTESDPARGPPERINRADNKSAAADRRKPVLLAALVPNRADIVSAEAARIVHGVPDAAARSSDASFAANTAAAKPSGQGDTAPRNTEAGTRSPETSKSGLATAAAAWQSPKALFESAERPPQTSAPAPALVDSARATNARGGSAAKAISSAVPETQAAEPPRLAEGPGIQTFPVAGASAPFSYDDELILEIRVPGYPGGDTIVAYGTREGTYLPLGTLARILDLAITVSDDGHFASGWFLDEARTLSLDLRRGEVMVNGKAVSFKANDALAFEGEMYVRTERFADLLPLEVTANLRDQSVQIKTREPFPFEARLARDAERERLNARQQSQTAQRWPREETPWLALSVPTGDLDLRAVSDSSRGERMEGDLRLAGDLAYLTAQVFLGANSADGLTSSHVELGRRSADADLLGPLKATEFQLGDVATTAMPIGLRGTSGRGAAVGNVPIDSLSIFEKVDLRGNLPDGYEVELYRNGILVASTRTPVNGQYEFLEVPVDFGLNVFRLVFFGPQGQRREEVRRFSVGDGRLAKGKLVYQLGIAQKDMNLLGVHGPNFFPTQDYGSVRTTGQLAYGLSSAVTLNLSGAWFESESGKHWIGSAGLRSGLGALAVKADLAVADGGAMAGEVGLGGRLLGTAFTLSHAEYSGQFVDETRAVTTGFLKRATELDANLNIMLGGGAGGTYLPLNGRLRRLEFLDGHTETNASLRGSLRFSGLVASNTLDFTRSTTTGGSAVNQLAGNFDLATLSRARTQARVSLGYAVVPDPELVSAGLEIDRAFDDRTLVNSSLNYSFREHDTQIGLSAVRRFDRFTLALDGRYAFKSRMHTASLRLGASFGRNPMTKRFFVAEPGQATSGAIAIRAFQDMNGDGKFDDGDKVLPGTEFFSSNQTGRTGADGNVRLGNLGSGNRVSVQVDTASLPDIYLAPLTRGIEIVPRPGRTHESDFAIVGMSDVEGIVYFRNNGAARGVAGVRLSLIDSKNEEFKSVRTEVDGYYFFEQVPPGNYELVIDPEQAKRLNICLPGAEKILVPPSANQLSRNLTIESCK